MTDKPEIKVGQRWVTRGLKTVRVLATDGRTEGFPIIVEYEDGGGLDCLRQDGHAAGVGFPDTSCDLLHLAPSTVKREVALYSDSNGFVTAFECDEQPDDYRKMISEPLTIEFTLLPGESAE